VRLPGLACLVVLLVAPPVGAADFTVEPPFPIARFADFEVLGGELVSPQLRAGYRFYVDPARAGLYTVMRYRLRSSGGGEPPREKFVWNERPGLPVPLRCFEWVEAVGGGSWRELDAGSAAYEREMQTLRLVLSEQNRDFRRRLEREAGP
jgi:hypothetical protein